MTRGLFHSRPKLASALGFLALALALRCVQFGNPAIQVDEQFYLLGGARMWDGLLPYVDVWDRKPIGLFLIYAAAAPFGDGILAYQLLASLFAAATAWTIARIGLRFASPLGAGAAGVIYLIFLLPNGGDGGQAPVFYNLFVAGAALAVVRAIEQPARAFAWGCAAMALTGVALQVKYAVVFEGALFGCALIYFAWRQGVAPARIAAMAAAWAGIALTPTLLVVLIYWAGGHLDAFVFANFESVFLRKTPLDPALWRKLLKIALRMSPLLAATAVAVWCWRVRGNTVHGFVLAWAGVALAGFVAFGTYHDHYVLPLIAPFALVGAPLYAHRVRGVPMAAALVAAAGLVLAGFVIADNRTRRGTAPEVRAMVAAIRLRPGEALYVFSGDPVLYHLTHSPLPTRFSFPGHLSDRRDSATLGVDAAEEVVRIMATRPRYVVTRWPYPADEMAPQTWPMMRAALAQGYHPVLAQPEGNRQRLLYERNP